MTLYTSPDVDLESSDIIYDRRQPCLTDLKLNIWLKPLEARFVEAHVGLSSTGREGAQRDTGPSDTLRHGRALCLLYTWQGLA